MVVTSSGLAARPVNSRSPTFTLIRPSESSFTSSVLTSIFTLGVFLAGRMLPDLEAFAIVTGNESVELSMDILSYVLPNLDLFDVRNAAVHGLPIEGLHLAWAVLYGVLYSGVLLLFADRLFRRREFK